MKNKVYSLFIGVPAYKWPVDIHHNASVQEICNHPGFTVDYRAIIGDAHIERARAMVLYEYLHNSQKFDFFLNVDWDIEFRAEDVYRMCKMSEELNRPVLGGPYTFKTKEIQGKNKQIVYRGKKGCELDEHYHLECNYLGGGFTLVRDDAIQKLCQQYGDLRFNANPDLKKECGDTFALWNPILINRTDWADGKGRELLSEDYSFCHRLNEIGYTCYLDMRTILKHWNGNDCYMLEVKSEEVG